MAGSEKKEGPKLWAGSVLKAMCSCKNVMEYGHGKFRVDFTRCTEIPGMPIN